MARHGLAWKEDPREAAVQRTGNCKLRGVAVAAAAAAFLGSSTCGGTQTSLETVREEEAAVHM